MEYKDERSEDLRLHLFRGAIDVEAFSVLARGRRHRDDFAIDASIIGASHAVQVRVGDEIITEVLACRVEAVDLFADRLLGVWKVGEGVILQPSTGLRYGFFCEAAPLGQVEEVVTEIREAVRSADAEGCVGLSFQFPQRTVRTPETLLYVSVQDTELSIRSAHIYPGEDVAVLSETRLTIATTAESELAQQLLEVGAR